MFGVIVDWHAPFAIVILEHQRIVHADPGTSFRTHKPRTLRHQSALIPPWRIRYHAAIRGATRWEVVAAAGASTTRPNVVRSSMSSRAFAASLSEDCSSECRKCCARLRAMFAAVLATLAVSATLASGAELRGTWSASTNSRYLAGTWTAVAQEDGSATGRWALQDATGKILMQGGWSASKSAQSWNGAWRATVPGAAAEYSGTWTGAVSLPPDARLSAMLESAVRAAVSGTWKTGPYSGSWSIRASP